MISRVTELPRPDEKLPRQSSPRVEITFVSLKFNERISRIRLREITGLDTRYHGEAIRYLECRRNQKVPPNAAIKDANITGISPS